MRLRINRRRAILGAGLLLAAALLILALLPDPVEVEVEPVRLGSLEVWIEEDGRTRAVDRYLVTAPVAGRLDRIALREGAHVPAGAAIARVEPLPLDPRLRGQLQAQLTAAVARERAAATAIAQAKAAAAQAARELERRRRLAEQGALATEQLERYALELRLREEEVEAAQQAAAAAAAEVASARSALLDAGTGAAGTPASGVVAVRAPVAGTVLRVPERSARTVAQGEPLLEIGDADVLEIVVDVLSTDAVRIRPDMPAEIHGWGGEPLAACVARVEPAAFTRVSALGVEEQRVNVVLSLKEVPPPGLGDGYRVDARVLVWAADAVLIAPAAALFRAGDGWRAFVVEDGRARLRDVGVGERSGSSMQVLTGLAEGDLVIRFPSDALEDGTRVAVR